MAPWYFGLLGASSAGPAGSYDLIETADISSTTSTVTFSGLGGYTDYKDLQIRGVVRSNANSSSMLTMLMYFNSDTGFNYTYHILNGNGSSVASTAESTFNRIGFQDVIPGGFSTTNAYGAIVADILDFSSSAKNTTVRALGGLPTDAESDISLFSGLWSNTSSVTSISFEAANASFLAGTRLSLYGIKG